jgi:hypothetical protein
MPIYARFPIEKGPNSARLEIPCLILKILSIAFNHLTGIFQSSPCCPFSASISQKQTEATRLSLPEKRLFLFPLDMVQGN